MQAFSSRHLIDKMDKEKELNLKKKEFYLSNERTFLSYVRTAASVMVLSVALFKFFSSDVIIAVGVGCLIIGFLIFILGLYRFFSEKRRIKYDEFLAS